MIKEYQFGNTSDIKFNPSGSCLAIGMRDGHTSLVDLRKELGIINCKPILGGECHRFFLLYGNYSQRKFHFTKQYFVFLAKIMTPSIKVNLKVHTNMQK